MKKVTFLLITVLIFQALTVCHQAIKKADANENNVSKANTSTYEKGKLISEPSNIITNLEIPKSDQQAAIISHTGYSFLYNEAHEQSDWVAYELTRAETAKTNERTNKFVCDPQVETGTADNEDYAGSGYDKGHLAPAADMGWSSAAMAESFYYSNMSPQVPAFNRGIWKRLEELVRTWAIDNNSVFITTGPVLTNGLIKIGHNGVSVPNYFYKVILDYNEPDIKGIGFILPNKGSSEQLQKYAVTIDSVEKFTGIDFFSNLPDDQEKMIESTLSMDSWIWKSSNTSIGKTSVSVQTNANQQILKTSKTKLNERVILTGPRGGKYYINKNGNKTYIKN